MTPSTSFQVDLRERSLGTFLLATSVGTADLRWGALSATSWARRRTVSCVRSWGFLARSRACADSWVSSIGIHPGHYNSQKSWDGNNIVTRAHVTVSSNGKVLNDQSHSFSGGRGEVQTIPVDADCSDHVTATFEIEQVRRGYYQSTNDTCIGDVFAYGL